MTEDRKSKLRLLGFQVALAAFIATTAPRFDAFIGFHNPPNLWALRWILGSVLAATLITNTVLFLQGSMIDGSRENEEEADTFILTSLVCGIAITAVGLTAVAIGVGATKYPLVSLGSVGSILGIASLHRLLASHSGFSEEN